MTTKAPCPLVIIADKCNTWTLGVDQTLLDNMVNENRHANTPDSVFLNLKSGAACLMIEAHLGGTHNGIEVAYEVSQQYPNTQIILVTEKYCPTALTFANALGCFDYINKDITVKGLAETVAAACQKNPEPVNSYFTKTKTYFASKFPPLALPGDQRDLTSREYEVATHVALGLPNKYIGLALGISVETVKEHVQNILRKVRATDRTQLATWMVKKQLIPDSVIYGPDGRPKTQLRLQSASREEHVNQ